MNDQRDAGGADEAAAGPPPLPDSIGTPGTTWVVEEGGKLVRAGSSEEAGSLQTQERLGPVGSEVAAAEPSETPTLVSAAPASRMMAAASGAPASGAAPVIDQGRAGAPVVTVTSLPASAPPATGVIDTGMGGPAATPAAAAGPIGSRVKLAGHPVHPMLIVFPLGLLGTSVIFDGIALARRDIRFATASFYMLPAGAIGGLTAAVFGLLDWLGIPAGSRAKRIGLLHGGGNVVVTGLFSTSWLLRRRRVTDFPDAPAMTLSVLGLGLALVTGWLGGELVDRLGVGVDPGANVDAPNSLSGEPAASPR